MNPHRLALGTALVLGLSTVAVSPAALAAPDATQTAVCDEVGQVTLETTGARSPESPMAPPWPWLRPARPASGPPAMLQVT